MTDRERKEEIDLELISIGCGYREIGQPENEKSGICNIDVVCPEGDDWRDEIDSVGVYTVNGSWMCTGTLVANTSLDGAPLFLTAYHCGINNSEIAQSVVVYWNFQSPECGDQGGGLKDSFQSGEELLARYYDTDFALIKLDGIPDPALGVKYAGWDRSSADPSSAVCIHHPNTDEKSISFEYDASMTTSYDGYTSPGDGLYLRVVDWDLGTTERGSSGSALFNPDHRVVGQLRGGYAACGNDLSDWYGRLSASWSGGGTSDSRLSDHLDPIGSGVFAFPLDINLTYSGIDDWFAIGSAGGPFSPSMREITISNMGIVDNVAMVSGYPEWLDISSSEVNVPADGVVVVTVSINEMANELETGNYFATLRFEESISGAIVQLPVELHVLDPVSPPEDNISYTGLDDWFISGLVGGPFNPGTRDVTISNTGTTDDGVMVSRAVDWLDVSPAEVDVKAGQERSITISLNDLAANLEAGVHSAKLTFSEIIGEKSTELTVELRVWKSDFPSAGPNPFSSYVEIRFALENSGFFRVRFLDLRGSTVRDMGEFKGYEGINTVTWNGRGEANRRLPAGVYVCLVEVAGNEIRTRVTLIH